jgi:hypothetical protein
MQPVRDRVGQPRDQVKAAQHREHLRGDVLYRDRGEA